jgi:hypothetical protein
LESLEVAQAYWVHPIHEFKDQLVDLDLLDDMYKELHDIKVTHEKEAIEKLSDEQRRIYIDVIASKSSMTEHFNLMLELSETLPSLKNWLIDNESFMHSKRKYWFFTCPYAIYRNKYPNYITNVLEPL